MESLHLPPVTGFNICSLTQGYQLELEIFLRFKKMGVNAWLNPIVSTKDLEEHAFPDIIVNYNSSIDVFEIKSVKSSSMTISKRWLTGFLRRSIEGLWIFRRLFKPTNIGLITDLKLGTLKDYGRSFGIEVISSDELKKIKYNQLFQFKEKTVNLSKSMSGREMIEWLTSRNLSVDQAALLCGIDNLTFWYNAKKERISDYLYSHLCDLSKVIEKIGLREVHFKANKLKAEEKSILTKEWETAKRHPEIVYIYPPHPKGENFERKVEMIFKELGYETIRNVGLLDELGKLRTTKYPEVDILLSIKRKKSS